MTDKKKVIVKEEPISASIGALSVTILIPLAIQLAMIFVMFWAFQKASKEDKNLSKKLNNVLKDGKNWTVVVIKEKSPNAFCMIKPVVFVTSGLLRYLNDDEVMAVLLHEAGHINNKDLVKTFIANHTLAAMVMSAAAVIGGPVAVYLVFQLYYLLGIKIVTVIFNRVLGRFHEKRADSYATKYGYADHMITALEKIEKYVQKEMNKQGCGIMCRAERKISEAIDEHPPVKERIENILKSKEISHVDH